jgi:hypothetical protein
MQTELNFLFRRVSKMSASTTMLIQLRSLAHDLMPSWPEHARFYAEPLLSADVPSLNACRHLAAMAWDALHATPWQEAELCWRHVYAVAQLSAALLVERDRPRRSDSRCWISRCCSAHRRSPTQCISMIELLISESPPTPMPEDDDGDTKPGASARLSVAPTSSRDLMR